MTLASLNTIVGWPGHCESISAAPVLATDVAMITAAQYQALVVMAQQAMTITHVGFRISTSTGSPVAEARLETLDALGIPSGTLVSSGANGTLSTAANNWHMIALGTPASIAMGQMFAVMVRMNSGSAMTVQRITGIRSGVLNLPYEVTNLSGSPVKNRMVGYKAIIVAGGGVGPYYNLLNLVAVTAINANAFNNTSSAARGLRFQVPFKCRCVGLRNYQGTANGDYNAVLYDDSGAELSSSSTAFIGNDSALNVGGSDYNLFDNPVTLLPGVWYRAALEPLSATNINMYTATLPSAPYRAAWAGGVNQLYTTRASGTWDDTKTDQIPFMDILYDQLDDGVGGYPASRLQLGH